MVHRNNMAWQIDETKASIDKNISKQVYVIDRMNKYAVTVIAEFFGYVV